MQTLPVRYNRIITSMCTCPSLSKDPNDVHNNCIGFLQHLKNEAITFVEPLTASKVL